MRTFKETICCNQCALEKDSKNKESFSEIFYSEVHFCSEQCAINWIKNVYKKRKGQME